MRLCEERFSTKASVEVVPWDTPRAETRHADLACIPSIDGLNLVLNRLRVDRHQNGRLGLLTLFDLVLLLTAHSDGLLQRQR